MPDRIYSFQQSLVLQLIEGLADLLLKTPRPKRAIQERWQALWRLTSRDRSLNDHLKPEAYFDERAMVWDGRVMTADIYEWLVDLHQHYDRMSQRSAHRGKA